MSNLLVLIDDDQDDLDIVKEVLEEIDSSLRCLCFVYPDEAVRALTEELIVIPQFVVIDMNMPRKTGMECLTELKAHAAFEHVPIVVYSTTVTPKLRNSLMEAGAAHVFQKPTTFQQWSSLMRKLLLNDWGF